jgi:hypothetical protein
MLREIRTTNRKDNWQGSKWIRQEKRLAIMIRDGFMCAYCGSSVEDGAKLTLDHITPVAFSETPNNTEKNLVCCCSTCNSKRGNTNLIQFLNTIYEDSEIVTALVLRVNRLRREYLSSYKEVAKNLLEKRSIKEFTGN